MSLALVELEVERIVQLSKMWGWELVSKRVMDQIVEIVLVKMLQRSEEESRDIFWMYARNILGTFLWKILEESTEENTLTVRAVKEVVPEESMAGE